MTDPKTRIAILGASGYTGAELVRLLLTHPHVEIKALTGDRQAGKDYAQVYPQFVMQDLPKLTKIDEVNWDQIDFVFCALPHGTTQKVIASLPTRIKIVDLSADFRLADTDLYAQVYGLEHQAPELQKGAVYGLTEIKREAIRAARLVANPGCYPTSAQLPLIPLLSQDLIEADPIIIDSKSGATGAGRSAKEGLLFTEVADGFHAYGIGNHRHGPEIDQGLSEACGKPVQVTFTPHLVPMARGILSTMYVRMSAGKTLADLRTCLEAQYKSEPFVHVLPDGQAPQTRHVRGSNHALISLHQDRAADRAILVCAEDNLVKGASGQAIHNMNLMLGFDETAGLNLTAQFP